MCAWSRGNSSHHRTFILYSHTASHATDTQLSLPLLPNHSFCSKAWNHSPDPLRQETDSQAYSQSLSRTHAQSAHYWVHSSPTYIFPKSRDWPCISHGPTCTHRLRPAGKQRNKHKNRRTQTAHYGITADYMFTWAEQYACDALTYQDPAGLSGTHPRAWESAEEAKFGRASSYWYTATNKIGIWKCFCFSKHWHQDQRACSNKAGKSSHKIFKYSFSNLELENSGNFALCHKVGLN